MKPTRGLGGIGRWPPIYSWIITPRLEMVPIAWRASIRWGNLCWTRSPVNHFPWSRNFLALNTQDSWILCWWVSLTCVSMRWSFVSCSIYSRLSSIGVICSAMSNVSNNGGNFGWRSLRLNTWCRRRNGGMVTSKALSPTTIVIFCGPYRSIWSLWWGP